MNNSVSIVLAGIGGYGNTYVQKLLDEGEKLNAHIVGIVDPTPEKSENYDRIIEQHIPIFSSLEEFYEDHRADLAILSTPIHLHASQTCYALLQGSNVLCEKPMCASLQEVNDIIQMRNKTGKFVAIGFNWSFTSSVQKLKKDILEGKFGEAIRLKTIVNWPRNEAYFKRNQWAGRLYSDEGHPIFDSVANNATAHYLHHMFYLLGPDIDQSVKIKEVSAELYRANPIENFDSCAVHITTAEEAEIYYYATHAVKDSFGPHFDYEFENATIRKTADNQIKANFHDGTEIIYPSPDTDALQKLVTCIHAIENQSNEILCGPEAAFTHVQAILTMHESIPDITPIPSSLIRLDKDSGVTWVEGLGQTFKQSYDQWCMPGDIGVSWAKKGKIIQIK